MKFDVIDNDLTQEEDTNNVTNSFLISPQFPFPVSGILYSPAHIVEPFKESEFQLISFVSSDGIIQEEENVVIEQDNTIEEDNVIEIDEISIDESIVEEIIEQVIEESIAEEIISEEVIIPVEPVVEEAIEEELVEEIIDAESSLDKSIAYVILLAVVVGGIIVYYKKFRNSNNNLKKSFVNNDKSTFSKTIHFDDKVAINIKEKQE